MIALQTLPNVLSLFRVIAALLLFFCALILPDNWKDGPMLGLFLVAVLTDYLDGMLARRFNIISKFGEFLDPVADKILITVTLLILLQDERAAFLPTTIIICREICMSALREWMAGIGQRNIVGVILIGKIKMVCQSIAIVLLLYRTEIYGINTIDLGNIILSIAATLTVISMALYIQRAIIAAKSEDDIKAL